MVHCLWERMDIVNAENLSAENINLGVTTTQDMTDANFCMDKNNPCYDYGDAVEAK